MNQWIRFFKQLCTVREAETRDILFRPPMAYRWEDMVQEALLENERQRIEKRKKRLQSLGLW